MYRISKPVTDLAAEVQPNPGGVLMDPTVDTGEATLENPRQILRCDADPGIRNDQLRSGTPHRDHPAGSSVFDCVGKQLFRDEGKPLFIRHRTAWRFVVVQRQLFADEPWSQLADHTVDSGCQIAFPEHIIRHMVAQPLIRQHHIRVLLDTGQFQLHGTPIRCILL